MFEDSKVVRNRNSWSIKKRYMSEKEGSKIKPSIDGLKHFKKYSELMANIKEAKDNEPLSR